MSKTGMAVIGITDETIIDCLHKKHKVIFVISTSKDWKERPLKKIPECEIKKVIPGKYFDDGHLFGFRLIFPREEDLIVRGQVGNNSIAIYKLYYFGSDYFSDGKESEYLSLARKVKVLAKLRFVLPSKDTVYRFVRSQLRGNFDVGRNSEERFGLERFNIAYGLGSYRHLMKKEWPEGFIRTSEFTTEECCRIIYGLVRMRHGLSPL